MQINGKLQKFSFFQFQFPIENWI